MGCLQSIINDKQKPPTIIKMILTLHHAHKPILSFVLSDLRSHFFSEGLTWVYFGGGVLKTEGYYGSPQNTCGPVGQTPMNPPMNPPML